MKNCHAFERNNNNTYSKTAADLKDVHGKKIILEQVTTELSNIIDVKNCDGETAGKLQGSSEEQPVDILNEILQYSDVISQSLNDYNDISIELQNKTDSKNSKVSSIGQNIIGKNISKMMAIEKSKAKENEDYTSETDSLEDQGTENTPTVKSTENYEYEFIKSLLPSRNVSIRLDGVKELQLKNKVTLPNNKKFKKDYIEANKKYKNDINNSLYIDIKKINNSDKLKSTASNRASTVKHKAVSIINTLLNPFGLKEPVKEVSSYKTQINNIILNDSLHKSKSLNESSVRDDKMAVGLFSDFFSSEQATTNITRPTITQKQNNETVEIKISKIFITERKNNTRKDNMFRNNLKTTSFKRPFSNLTKHPKTSSVYTLKPLKLSKSLPKTFQNTTDTVNRNKTGLPKKDNKMNVNISHSKVGPKTISHKTGLDNIKNTFAPSKLFKNNTLILKALTNIVKELNNILVSSSERDTESDEVRVIDESKNSSEHKSTNISHINNINKPVRKHKVVHSVKQKNLMITDKKSKIREKAKKMRETKRKVKNIKLKKPIKIKNIVQSKAENTTYEENKNITQPTHKKLITETNDIVAQETKITNPFIDEEEIRTQNEKGLSRALQTCDNYTKALYSNKIRGIIDGKTKNTKLKDEVDSDELSVTAIVPDDNVKNTKVIEVYEDYVKRLESKKFGAKKNKQKVDDMDNIIKDKPMDKNTSEIIENCGIVHSNFTTEKGLTSIEDFPWLGVLCYRESKNMSRFTNVILVTRNMVIASALDIFKIPKAYFRQRSKVVLGHPCNFRPGLRVLGYNYHPEYGMTTYSTIALVQLDVGSVEKDLHPICGNSNNLVRPQLYALVLPESKYTTIRGLQDGPSAGPLQDRAIVCKQASVSIYEINLLDLNLCRSYYNGIGLISGRLWPKHASCGVALHHDGCLWRNGVALVFKQEQRWHLMGFGVNGPGCGAPSRYVNYSVYSAWVAGSSARIGRPALTRLADNHLILRRSKRLLQRHGPCDPFEKQSVLYTNHYETTKHDVHQDSIKKSGVFRYNITLHPGYDYSCIDIKSSSSFKIPLITIRRYSRDQSNFNQVGFVHYSLKVYFSNALDIIITAYGNKTVK